ncbi:mCG147251 [Mus musculus]|uniref:Uncharacterized protein n=1 Tax=Mus musculus TaxID=10090 RepID=Q3TQ57_MOUSE|nr:mCG147251 [Mus musculus]BAE37528.1 unnamed protein product [Mus musculus]
MKKLVADPAQTQHSGISESQVWAGCRHHLGRCCCPWSARVPAPPLSSVQAQPVWQHCHRAPGLQQHCCVLWAGHLQPLLRAPHSQAWSSPRENSTLPSGAGTTGTAFGKEEMSLLGLGF